MQTISLPEAETGSMFTIKSGVTLTLGGNITLRGQSSNTAGLVNVNDGMLVMEDGSKITGNTSSSGSGGVYVAAGTFTMKGGEISGNTAGSGGGVEVNSGTFTMDGGKILGNTASSLSGGTFIMTGGEISDNTAANSGSGVYVSGSVEISGNTVTKDGGAVYVADGTFTMSGGEVSGNTATDSGGGVYVSGGTFKKQPAGAGSTSGVIYGSDASPASKANTATGGSGHAVFVSAGMKRETTVEETQSLDSTLDDAEGGWTE